MPKVDQDAVSILRYIFNIKKIMHSAFDLKLSHSQFHCLTYYKYYR